MINFKHYIIALCVLFLALIACTPMGVYAAEGGSYVLDDLRADSNFNEAEYTLDYSDYTLKVIQIAESTEGELLIYVYQPSGKTKDYRASSINISTDENSTFRNYGLEYLNSSESLYKYKVRDLTAADSVYRLYEIASIYRPYDEDVDGPAEGDNYITEKAFRVGQRWNLMTTNDGVVYSMQNIDVVEVEDKFVGYVHYQNGFYLLQNSCDSHFVAFSTDWNMDDLFEVELDYYVTPYEHKIQWYPSGLGVETSDSTYAIDDPQRSIQTVNHLQSGEYVKFGWVGKKYSWDRIRTVDEFLENESEYLLDEDKPKFDGKQWVVSFLETPSHFTSNITGSSGVQIWSYSRVEQLTILRLKFESAGKTYNLGVVDNKTSEGLNQKPSGIVGNGGCDSFDWFAFLLTIIAIIVIVILLLIFATWILSALGNFLIAAVDFIGKGLLLLLKGIWWLIKLPFKGIAALARKLKNRTTAKKTTARPSAKTSKVKSGGGSKVKKYSRKRR